MNASRTLSITAPVAIAALAALLLTGVLAPPAAVGVAAQDNSEPRIAVVNPLNAISRLDELPVREAQWQQLVESAQAELDALRRQAETIQSELEELNLTEDEQIDRQLQLVELDAQAQGRRQGRDAFLDARRGQLVAELFQKVVTETERIRVAEGYDIVLVNDTEIVPPNLASAQRVQEAIQRRRVIAYNPRVDLTDQVVRNLNAVFNAGAGD